MRKTSTYHVMQSNFLIKIMLQRRPILFVISIALLLLSLYGDFCGFRRSDFVMPHHIVSAEDKSKFIHNFIIDRFRHDYGIYTLTSNWLLSTLGVINKNFNHIYDPKKLLQISDKALCDQAASVMRFLANENGVTTRVVALQGHVVVETLYNGQWHLFDPGLKFYPIAEGGDRVLSLQEFINSKEVLSKYINDEALKIYKEVGKHNTVAYPPYALFTWKADFFRAFQLFCDYLKYALPLCLFIVLLHSQTVKKEKSSDNGSFNTC